MATYRKYGYSSGPYTQVTAKVSSNTSTIVDGDIVVLAASDAVAGTTYAGYIKKWTAVTDEVVGVALEGCTAPSTDGGTSIEIVLAVPGSVFCFSNSSVTQAYCFQCCDVDGAQSIDHDRDAYQNVWIVKVDTDEDLIYVMFKGPFTDTAAGSDAELDYGSS